MMKWHVRNVSCSNPKRLQSTKDKDDAGHAAGMDMKGSGTPTGSMSMMPSEMGQMKPKPEELAWTFLSIGVAACKDLDNSKS